MVIHQQQHPSPSGTPRPRQPLKVAVPEAAVHEAPYFPDKEMADFLSTLGVGVGELEELEELGVVNMNDIYEMFFVVVR